MDSDEMPTLDMQIITIVLDEDQIPRMDLGDCHPAVAYSILTKALEGLEMILPTPTVIYRDEKILEEFTFIDDEDDD